MNLYFKAKSYQVNISGTPVAYVIIRINPFNLKTKAEITMVNGSKYEIVSQSATEEQFDDQVEQFVRNKYFSWE
jgi:hypothetical protein